MDERTQHALHAFWLSCGLADAAWPAARDAFVRFHDLIAAANDAAGLMGPNWDDGFYFKHVADSLAALRAFQGTKGPRGHGTISAGVAASPGPCSLVPSPWSPVPFRLADVGCGAGFPGFILAIALPGLRLTAIESNHKKAQFVASAARELGLGERVEVVARRARELGHDPAYAGRFDIVTARAVASADRLIRECRLLLNQGTRDPEDGTRDQGPGTREETSNRTRRAGAGPVCLSPSPCSLVPSLSSSAPGPLVPWSLVPSLVLYKTPDAVAAEMPPARREAAKHGLVVDVSDVIALPGSAGLRQFLRVRHSP